MTSQTRRDLRTSRADWARDTWCCRRRSLRKPAMQSALTEHAGCKQLARRCQPVCPVVRGWRWSFASTLTSDPACHKVFQLEAAHDRRGVRAPCPPAAGATRALSVCRAWPHGSTSAAEAQLGHSAGSSLNSEFQPPALGLSVNEGGWLTTRPQRILKAQHFDKM